MLSRNVTFRLLVTRRSLRDISPTFANFSTKHKALSTSQPDVELVGEPNTMGKYFAKRFLADAKQSGKLDFGAKTGACTEVDKESILQFFPEGTADSVNNEFNFTESKSWMIRDSGKFLCRILDDYVAGQGQQVGVSKVVKTIEKRVRMPPLTSAKMEWDSARTRVSFFGTELVQKAEKVGRNTVTGGEGSLVDKWLLELNEKSAQNFPKHILITGDRGSGKSVALTQMVLHARSSGWLCLYIPKGWEQAHGGFMVRQLDEAVYGPVLYDNTQQSGQVLRNFWRAHGEVLRTLPVRNPEAFAKYRPKLAEFAAQWDLAMKFPGREDLTFMEMRSILEAEADLDLNEDAKDQDVLKGYKYCSQFVEPTNLEDLLKFGVAFRENAGPVFMDLMAELQKVTEVPVLVAVDEYNSWEVDSAFVVDHEAVHSKDLCVPRTLNFFTRTNRKGKPARIGTTPPPIFTLQNGICVGATSLRSPESKHITFAQSLNSVDLSVHVPVYNQVEYLSAVGHYCHRNVVSGEMDFQHFLAYRTYSGSNPLQVRKLLVPYFFPRNVRVEVDRMRKQTDEEAAKIQAAGKISARRFIRRRPGDDDDFPESPYDDRYGRDEYDDERDERGEYGEYEEGEEEEGGDIEEVDESSSEGGDEEDDVDLDYLDDDEDDEDDDDDDSDDGNDDLDDDDDSDFDDDEEDYDDEIEVDEDGLPVDLPNSDDDSAEGEESQGDVPVKKTDSKSRADRKH